MIRLISHLSGDKVTNLNLRSLSKSVFQKQEVLGWKKLTRNRYFPSGGLAYGTPSNEAKRFPPADNL